LILNLIIDRIRSCVATYMREVDDVEGDASLFVIILNVFQTEAGSRLPNMEPYVIYLIHLLIRRKMYGIYLWYVLYSSSAFYFTYSDKVLSSSVLAHRLALLEFSTEDIII
jgi:hypothetical protein